jgi:hypothetical protein
MEEIMNRTKMTAITLFAIASLALAAAAYAPHSSTLVKLARATAPSAPCATTMGFPAESKPVQQAAAYPAPSEEVIARGHSAAAN